MKQDAESTCDHRSNSEEVAARAIAELEAAGALQRTERHIAQIDRAKPQKYVTEQ